MYRSVFHGKEMVTNDNLIVRLHKKVIGCTPSLCKMSNSGYFLAPISCESRAGYCNKRKRHNRENVGILRHFSLLECLEGQVENKSIANLSSCMMFLSKDIKTQIGKLYS